MSVNSILLLAQNAYNKVSEQPYVENVQEAANFHKMVNVAFNNYAHMSPDQILQHIIHAKASGSANVNAAGSNGIAETIVGELRKKVSTHEQTIRKSLINEASLADLMYAANEAKNTVQTMVALRDKFLESFEKVMNMQI
ncbi:Flagellar hook-basal body complex protein FliE [Candidatus Trichorickettsia mobilis]|uniref:Flagellar hook-basal body complex protein FliE n=1 Tax=Candidatus Trichorickettsia mobilis TaxID=1346319 RepID=A0ABZ0UR88_9RICK|nr:flagellar hook-basal body complex protein FliE [Candidatus Trichorickettsia mobilis]WPY00559.1 Flagellar hook-basal body complex protein FliE [Candidatus Trichorickettsia mobilis]